jgi:hypothetical protein
MADEKAFGMALAATHGHTLARGDVQAIIEARFSSLAAQEAALAAFDRAIPGMNANLEETCGACLQPWGSHGHRAPHRIPPDKLHRTESPDAGSICPGFWPTSAGPAYRARPGYDPACPCGGAALPPGGDGAAWLQSATMDQVLQAYRDGRITQAQREAYRAAWSLFGHAPDCTSKWAIPRAYPGA